MDTKRVKDTFIDDVKIEVTKPYPGEEMAVWKDDVGYTSAAVKAYTDELHKQRDDYWHKWHNAVTSGIIWAVVAFNGGLIIGVVIGSVF